MLTECKPHIIPSDTKYQISERDNLNNFPDEPARGRE